LDSHFDIDSQSIYHRQRIVDGFIFNTVIEDRQNIENNGKLSGRRSQSVDKVA
jgi:hypothetical protein